MKPVSVHPEALEEWRQAVRYYAERNLRAASIFNQLVRDALQLISETPTRYGYLRRMKPMRRFLLRRFPFSIIYLDYPDQVWVFAIAHHRRQPRYWKRRV